MIQPAGGVAPTGTPASAADRQRSGDRFRIVRLAFWWLWHMFSALISVHVLASRRWSAPLNCSVWQRCSVLRLLSVVASCLQQCFRAATSPPEQARLPIRMFCGVAGIQRQPCELQWSGSIDRSRCQSDPGCRMFADSRIRGGVQRTRHGCRTGGLLDLSSSSASASWFSPGCPLLVPLAVLFGIAFTRRNKCR